MKTVLKTLLILIVFVLLGGLVFIYSGVYNIAATSKDPALLRWALHTTMERSVERRADTVKLPTDSVLSDPATINTGFRHYNEMCILCHGAPGVKPGEAHAGLNPEPPALAKHAEEMSPGELFWVIKNGIKMTGMPAWGPTHSDADIWAMVAFIKTLPDMTPAHYKALQEAARQTPASDGHASGHAHPAAH